MRKITLLTVLILGLSFFICQNVFAIGQITEPIVIKDVLRGQEATAILILSNSEDKEVAYELIIEGEVKDWASFYKIDDENLENPITQIQVPAQSSINATVKFKVPEDMPNGDYSGVITIMTVPEEKEEIGGVSTTVRLRVSRGVLITVTDQEIIKFDTAIIALKYGVKRGEPLKIKVIYDNQGNVLIKPDLQLKITKDGATIHNAIYPYPENEEAVKPRINKTLTQIEWQTSGQESGLYRAEIEILVKGEVYQEESFRFSIKQGGLSGIVKGIKDINFEVFWPVILLVLVVIFTILVIVFVKKNMKEVNSNSTPRRNGNGHNGRTNDRNNYKKR